MLKRIITCLCLVFIMSGCGNDNPSNPPEPFTCGEHTGLGIPSEADQLLYREGYTAGYDYEKKVASWVAYCITAENVNKVFERSNNFQPDLEIPENHRAELSDYKNSGYDRGHLTPNATVDFSQNSMEESFLLSNMASQLAGFNRAGWKGLEEEVRDWANEREGLYVVTGTLFEGEYQTIGENKIGVPTHFYKIIYDPVEKAALAFLIPHENFSKTNLSDFITSVDVVEKKTGLDFLNLLEDEVEEKVESEVGKMW